MRFCSLVAGALDSDIDIDILPPRPLCRSALMAPV